MNHSDIYFDRLAAAFVRGKLLGDGHLFDHLLSDLNADDLETLFKLGKAEGLKLHKFKKTMGLPRVEKVIGILKGLQAENLLDVGTGRGAFLWPLLDQFPTLPIHCLDQLDFRVEGIQAVQAGGYPNIEASLISITDTPFKDQQFDISTALEVLEHIEEIELAIKELIRVTKRFIIITVPSKEDDNPEHIHLLTKQRLTQYFHEQGVTALKFDAVLNHLVLVANLNYPS